MTETIDVVITKVQIMGNRQLKIEGIDKEQHDPVKFSIDDILVGQISFIIDSLPPFNEYQSVVLPLNISLWGPST